MAENERDLAQEGRDNCSEAVCIDAMRIYDSCSDKDCLEDIRVIFTTPVQEVINCASNVRIRDVQVLDVCIDLQPIPFNRGFYSVDMTFYFKVTLDVFAAQPSGCTVVSGVSVFNKKVILFGSEGNVKMFSSGGDGGCRDPQSSRVMPKATVQVAEPIALSAKLCECAPQYFEPCSRIPDSIREMYGGEFATGPQLRTVYATIGLFTIVQIIRNVQMMVPAYDFCVPEKECVPTSDNPCELFSRIEFPTSEFFPPRAGGDCGCGQP